MTGTTTPGASGDVDPAPAIVAAAREVVREHQRQRLELDALWAAVETADPLLRGSPQARRTVRAVIDLLAAEGVIRLPGQVKDWDRREIPDLPRWVRRPPAPARPTGPGPVWPAALEPAAAVARGADLEALHRIARWLRQRPADPISVPIEERSAQIFGDEKRLARLMAGRLFTGGHLTPDLLACHRTPLPLASQFVPGVGPVGLLVLENAATYFSCLTVLRSLEPDRRPSTHVAWGHGHQAARSMGSVRWLDPAPQVLRYFGDLDVAGLRIALDVAAAASSLGLPAVEPASALYDRLLRLGEISADGSGTAGPELVERVADWFGPTTWAGVGPLLERRERLAQEYVGREVLAADPWLLTSR